ncbi:MAG: ABC transporter ATP-binding protein/permease [Caldiserica bacterium]|jgi:ATP-binding cassette subfamily B protein|nr:ABC transporter ATP-binding protein/permease [Caldisericota bacterium]MDH7562050.1 ABC transporter ATP-binding protein [Caldisericota bacterium]
MERVWKYIFKNWKKYLWAILALILVDGLQLLLPLVFGYFIDAVSRKATGTYIYGLYFLALAIMITLLRYAYRWQMGKLALFFDRNLREEFFREVLSLPLDFLQKEDIGDIMARATNDMQAVRQFLIFGLIGFTDVIVLGISTVVLMLSLNVKLFLATVGPISIIAILALFFSRYIFGLFKVVQDVFGKLTERAQEFISGIRVLRAFSKESKVMELFQQVNREYYQTNMRLVKLEGIFEPSMGFLVMVSVVLAFFFGSNLVKSGEMSLGLLVAFVNYINTLSWPMMALGFTTTVFQRSKASLKRVEEILTASKEKITEGPPLDPGEEFRSLKVSGLSFILEGRKVLDEVSFHLERGQVLGIVGPVGAGKSTLFRLILRLVEPEEGRIFLNGIDVKRIPLPELRKFFALVPQDNYLFSATLLENIRYSRPDAEVKEVEEVARISCLDEEIEQFPDGLETLVGEKGVTLSGGQRQRVAIARALISGRPVLLLDDALSAVDTVTEEKLVANLKDHARKWEKSVITISHRVSTLLWADSVLVLLGGKVKELGTPSELLQRGGYFSHLYRSQILEGRADGAGIRT